jgi:phage baseplate assembly protein W
LTTGKGLDGLEHLFQSIRDILTTPVGSRVMRREYGSRLFGLVDRPMEPGLDIEIKAAVAEALNRWEPRFRLTFVRVTKAAAGGLQLDLRGVYRPNGQEITLEGVVA